MGSRIVYPLQEENGRGKRIEDDRGRSRNGGGCASIIKQSNRYFTVDFAELFYLNENDVSRWPTSCVRRVDLFHSSSLSYHLLGGVYESSYITFGPV